MCIGRSQWRTSHLAKVEAGHNMELWSEEWGGSGMGAYSTSGTAVGD